MGIPTVAGYGSFPNQVGLLATWSSIGTAQYTAGQALQSNGTQWTWGRNNFGQLGQGDAVDRSSPTQVGALATWAQPAVGFNRIKNSMAAVKTDGTLWVWGQNTTGQLGLNDTVDRSSPVQVGSLSTWKYVSSSDSWMAAVKTDGSLWAWGRNNEGQLGQSNIINRSSPVQIGTGWQKVFGGKYSCLAIKTGGTLWAWGYNGQGNLGLGNVDSPSSPVQVGSLNTWNFVATCSFGAGAIKTDGTLWTWGQQSPYRILGLNDAIFRSSPTQVGTLSNWQKIIFTYSAGHALKTDGTIWHWGSNNQYTFGDGTSTGRSSPVQMGALTSWLDLAAIAQHTMFALKTP
jgi:alpha-tubulin suppressor-like RCC1 family protein